jgi:hypothetical protein
VGGEEGRDRDADRPPSRPGFPFFLRLYITQKASKSSQGNGGREARQEGGREGGREDEEETVASADLPSLAGEWMGPGISPTEGLPFLPPFHAGRAPLARIVEEWCTGEGEEEGGREGAREERRGVVVCGPKSMMREVRDVVLAREGEVDLHEEVFHW